MNFKLKTTNRGFNLIETLTHPNKSIKAILQESSKIGDYQDSMEKPGSSYLWINEDFHLNREEVLELVEIMLQWLKNGKLNIPFNNSQNRYEQQIKEYKTQEKQTIFDVLEDIQKIQVEAGGRFWRQEYIKNLTIKELLETLLPNGVTFKVKINK
jgi:hypothetical protein